VSVAQALVSDRERLVKQRTWDTNRRDQLIQEGQVQVVRDHHPCDDVVPLVQEPAGMATRAARDVEHRTGERDQGCKAVDPR
jgi:hypothetical protein